MLLSEYLPSYVDSILKCNPDNFKNDSVIKKFNILIDRLSGINYSETKVIVTVNINTILEFNKVI